jgi:hypothetical protein
MPSRQTSSMPRVLALVLLGFITLLFWLSGCASTPRHFSSAPVLWTDDDFITFGAIERPCRLIARSVVDIERPEASAVAL